MSTNLPATGKVVLYSYSVFRLESLYNCHLGLFKATLHFIHLGLKSLSILPLRKLHRMNLFLREPESFHMCSKMHVDFKVTSKSLYLNRFFSAYVVVGMLKAKRYKHIKTVLPSFVAIVDRAAIPLNPGTKPTI